VDDSVAVRQGTRVTQRFRELEVESRVPNGDVLKRIALGLVERGAERLAPVPKLIRALGPRAMAPSDIPAPPAVTPRSPASDAVRAILANALSTLISSDPGVRLDEPEGVHDMRIAVRKLRSYLRMFGPLIEPLPATIKDGLNWLAEELGRVRDLDVLLARIDEQASDLLGQLQPMVQTLNTRREARRLNLNEAILDDRYVALLDSLLPYVHRPLFTELASDQCRWVLPRLAAHRLKSLSSAVKDLGRTPSDEQYHQVRIQAKRTRYACEVVGGYLDKEARTQSSKLARQAENVQNILGERQDCVVMRQVMLEAAEERPEDGAFNLAIGRLTERQQQSITICEARFQEAWAELNRKKYREWLNA
jgi:CHAD domain-containing protein